MYLYLYVCDLPPEVQLEALAFLLALEAGGPGTKVMAQGHLGLEEEKRLKSDPFDGLHA